MVSGFRPSIFRAFGTLKNLLYSAFWLCVCRPPSSMVKKFRIRGVTANCTWGLKVSDSGTEPCSLRPVLAAFEACELPLKADVLSPANPLHECWNRHATNTSEVRLAWTLNLTCQPHAMTYSRAPRPQAEEHDSVYNNSMNHRKGEGGPWRGSCTSTWKCSSRSTNSLALHMVAPSDGVNSCQI